MKRTSIALQVILLSICTIILVAFAPIRQSNPSTRFISYTVDAKTQDLRFYWRNDKSVPFKSIHNLKTWLAERDRTLVFAMNGGMYKTDNSPLGLYIEEGKTHSKLNTASGEGNFYIKPNGVFYITANKQAGISKTTEFNKVKQVQHATQSGPMLLADGIINDVFKKGSQNLNIRNGVGILPGGKVLFAMSKEPVNFYDFAEFFKTAGCQNALYLDGFVSRTYLPEQKWEQTDGNFGVLIAVTIGNNK